MIKKEIRYEGKRYIGYEFISVYQSFEHPIKTVQVSLFVDENEISSKYISVNTELTDINEIVKIVETDLLK